MPVGKTTFTGPSELRESLLDILKDVSPNEDNFFVSNLGVAPVALQQLHEWNLFYEARSTGATARVEGADTTFTDLQVETRSNNRTIIIDSPVKLSRTRASIANVTGEDALAVEKRRGLRRLKSDMEFTTVNGSGPTSGASGVASNMSGIVNMISTNVTARASGTSFTEVELNDIVQESWDAVGASWVMDMLAAPVVIKRRIGSFGTNLTRNVQASDKRLTQDVRVYDSDVGQTIMIIAHKDLPKAAGTLTVLGLREELFEHSFLVNSGEPHWEDRAKTGDAINGVYITEFTMVSFEEKASVKRAGYNTGL